jgi:hypothetical protein
MLSYLLQTSLITLHRYERGCVNDIPLYSYPYLYIIRPMLSSLLYNTHCERYTSPLPHLLLPHSLLYSTGYEPEQLL